MQSSEAKCNIKIISNHRFIKQLPGRIWFCHDKRTVYQNYRTASEQSGTGEACDESESYADSTGILRVSALSFHAVYGQKSVALAGDARSGSVFVGLSVVRKIINAPRPYEKFDMPPVLEKDTKGNHFQAGMYFLFLLLR